MTEVDIREAMETEEAAASDRLSFEQRIEVAKDYLTGTDHPTTNEKLDELDLSISDMEIHEDLAHIELQDMAEGCCERIWIAVVR